MPEANRKREVGRGERVLPGVWRLRLPLPWPGVPHCNAWALAAGDGIVLVDTGMHEPGSMANLERALAQVNLKLEHIRLLVCTHAHSDHYGQAATIVERTGCELWMHPNHEHMLSAARDPEAAFDRRIEVARQSGVPEEPLKRYSEARRGQGYGIAGDRRAGPRPRAGRRDQHRPGRLAGLRDARPRAVARLPLPGGAPDPDLRRPSARPRLAVLRLRLLARSGRRVPALARPRRGARRAALPRRPRPDVHRRPGAHRRQPRARARAHRQGRGGHRGRAGDHRVRRDPADLRRGDHAADGQLVAVGDALLPAPSEVTGGWSASRARPSAGRSRRSPESALRKP